MNLPKWKLQIWTYVIMFQDVLGTFLCLWQKSVFFLISSAHVLLLDFEALNDKTKHLLPLSMCEHFSVYGDDW